MASEQERRTRRWRPKPRRGTLGTFAGVFTPSILTILGLILFLKTGYVVGAAGLGRALLIILLANSISVLTSISLSAVATNLRVKGGGDYYLISRTLGVQYGGALGIVLFLAQSVSVAFYAIGFGEVLTSILGRAGELGSRRRSRAVAVACLFVLAWLGADWATRFQYVVMVVLFAGIARSIVGRNSRLGHGQPAPEPRAGQRLVLLGAVRRLLPRGDRLHPGREHVRRPADPGKSLPRGTFLAVGISMLVYFSAALVFAAARPGAQLVAEDTTGDARDRDPARPGRRRCHRRHALVGAGLVSRGAANPAVAGERSRLSRFSTPSPRAAARRTTPDAACCSRTVIAFVTIGLGNIDAIAPVVSMFFLISYGLLNYATYSRPGRTAPPSAPASASFTPG